MTVRLAIAGVGNCASSLVQGIHYYALGSAVGPEPVIGLSNARIGPWTCADIEIIAAFDVDRRKVGVPLGAAVFAPPNCAAVFCPDLPAGVTVEMAPPLDGIAPHMTDWPEDRAFRVAQEPPVDVAAVLVERRVDVLVCYMPGGADEAVRYYADACLASGAAMVNCTPSFIASDLAWAARFRNSGVAIVGDDIKSQVGATIVHRVLARLFADRGVHLDRTYQLNTGGNTDFLNMLARDRIASKRLSKTNAVVSQLDHCLAEEDVHIGPSDYVPWQGDNKVCFIHMEGRGFGATSIEIDVKMSVQDSPNSAGIVIDAIRCAALAKRRGIGGPQEAASAYLMKSPPRQMRDSMAREELRAFLDGAG